MKSALAHVGEEKPPTLDHLTVPMGNVDSCVNGFVFLSAKLNSADSSFLQLTFHTKCLPILVTTKTEVLSSVN